jgi:hypothetical protein
MFEVCCQRSAAFTDYGEPRRSDVNVRQQPDSGELGSAEEKVIQRGTEEVRFDE